MDLKEIEHRAKKFSVNSLLKNKGFRNLALNFEEAYMLGVYSLSHYDKELSDLFGVQNNIAEKQSIAALCTFHNQAIYSDQNSHEQIAGIVAAIFDYDISRSQFGLFKPRLDHAMDNCGMGGDMYRTPNVSTIAALIASSTGIKMLKHGSPGNTDSTGSSDFLSYCGANLFPSQQNVSVGLEDFSFGYIDALDTRYKRIHVQTHGSAKLAHMNDIIGPMTNPLDPLLMKKRVVGINHLMSPIVVAKAYQRLNKAGVTNLQHGLFIRGFVDGSRNGGIDEVSIYAGGTIVAEFYHGDIMTYELSAEDFGIRSASYEEPPLQKAAYSRNILHGSIEGHHLDLVCANAAALFYLENGLQLKQGMQLAREQIESKKPLQVLDAYAEISNTR